MKRIFDPHPSLRSANIAALLGRIGVGSIMLTHGLPKIKMLGNDPVEFFNFMGIGTELTLALSIFVEVGCSLLIILGLGTRLAALILALNMLVIAFIVHATDPFGVQEKSLLFLVGALMLLFLGGGKYSLDNALTSKHNA